jgi:hypothetical protein
LKRSLCSRTTVGGFGICFLILFSSPFKSHEKQELNSHKPTPPTELHMGGRHTYDEVLHSAPKGSFATLLSPPQYHAVLSTVPHNLA